MRRFVLYAFDHLGCVRFSEAFVGLDGADAAKRGAERLMQFAGVEVWEDAVCIYHRSRRPAGEERP